MLVLAEMFGSHRDGSFFCFFNDLLLSIPQLLSKNVLLLRESSLRAKPPKHKKKY